VATSHFGSGPSCKMRCSGTRCLSAAAFACAVVWTVWLWLVLFVYVLEPSWCRVSFLEPLCETDFFFTGLETAAAAILLFYPHTPLRSNKTHWPLHVFGVATLAVCVLVWPLDRMRLTRWLVYLGLLSGRAGCVYCGLLLLSVSRKTVKMSLDSLGYVDLVPFHRTAGWWCVAMIMIHSVAFFLYYVIAGGWDITLRALLPLACDESRRMRHGGSCMNTLGLVNFFGVVGTLFCIVLAVFSLYRFRRALYEIFYSVHVWTSAGFCLAGALHFFPMIYFMLPAAAFYAFDRLFSRHSRMRHSEVEASIVCQSTLSTIALLTWSTVPPLSDSPGHRWVSICADGVSKTEWHPFSVMESRGKCRVLVKGLGDWSNSVCQSVAAGVPLSVRVEGPFARPLSARSKAVRSLLLVAGGVGVSPFVDLLCSPGLQEGAQRPRVSLLWALKHDEYVGLSAVVDLTAISRVADVVVFITSQNPESAQAADFVDGSRMIPLPGSSGVPLKGKLLHGATGYLLASVFPLAVVLASVHLSVTFMPGLRHSVTTLTGYAFVARLLPVLVALFVALFGNLGLFLLHGLHGRLQHGAASSGPDEVGERLAFGRAQEDVAGPSRAEVKFAKPDLHAEIERDARLGPLDVQVCGPERMTIAVQRCIRALKKDGLDVSLDVHDPDL